MIPPDSISHRLDEMTFQLSPVVANLFEVLVPGLALGGSWIATHSFTLVTDTLTFSMTRCVPSLTATWTS